MCEKLRKDRYAYRCQRGRADNKAAFRENIASQRPSCFEVGSKG